MANFATHLYGAAAVSSTAAIGLFAIGLADAGQAQAYFAVGVVGGLLPDIDSDSSTPVRAFFVFIGAAAAFLVSFALIEHLALIELALVWSAVFLFVRYGLFEVFAHFTVHRGLWHSWLAALFAALATANLAYWVVGCSAWESWVFAAFTGLGYLTHLCLDELASVNLLNSRVKRSLGTALKPFSLRSSWSSLGMAGVVMVLVLTAPSLAPVAEAARGLGYAQEGFTARLWHPSPWLTEWRGWVSERMARLGAR
ncbi:putative membrane-bound metal-dependent hydrolase (DUF457) [Thioflavicoccus mobilis 8321]|uniref:Putative membrane-bound metal-dependent hydrolase (DUF457) n=1 Tax=Thioflavicoccus mobilis 8321 TaxID=765912 RepID=L0GSL7_9GAMM|nr:metal-dependent hydrolase [Thioflavicoccus mobilis]AGA89763.1 putative membrane-bound metal-dependent hydrolase (DUF457) [Thioflavicoccus mobilis 8321]